MAVIKFPSKLEARIDEKRSIELARKVVKCVGHDVVMEPEFHVALVGLILKYVVEMKLHDPVIARKTLVSVINTMLAELSSMKQ